MTDVAAWRPRRRAVSPDPFAATHARLETWACAALMLLVFAEIGLGIVRTAALYVAP